jgi:hypothetical protein
MEKKELSTYRSKPIIMKKFLLVFIMLIIACQVSKAQNNATQKKDDSQIQNNSKLNKLAKSAGYNDRKYYFMNANKVATNIYNYGGIAPGYGRLVGVNNGVWHGLSYIFQFCPIVGGSVPDGASETKRLHIISDGVWDYNTSTAQLREVNPAGDTLWCFEPLEGYDDASQEYMASNPANDNDGDGKPDSWPRSWYNATLGKYVWPGYLAQDVTSADLEVYWAMDDRDNREFNYFPFPEDSTRRGLGIQVDGRALQWSNTLAENSIFFIYTITNVSKKNLDSLIFGMYGDPDVGGGAPENEDDNGYFVPPYNYDGAHDVSAIDPSGRSIIYCWDPDMKGVNNIKSGYVACKFLESPGNSSDGIDNDGDGMIDESQSDGIDNDHDWVASTDDVGIDGVANTGDAGEGDGLPTAGRRLANGTLDPLHPGEPNFEYTDLDESDQIGLTSFNSWTWNKDKVSNDESMWNRMAPGNFGAITETADIVFVLGSGYISLQAGEVKRFSMALLFGESLSDLLTTASTVQKIYNKNYKFYQPPTKPTITAVGDDRKVTLYWDTQSEASVDPILGKDFEGYVIYRSTDPSFSDIQTITDGKGNSFFSTPLKKLDGSDCRWDVAIRDEPYVDKNGNGKYDMGEPFTDINLDGKWTANIPDWWKGYHPLAYEGRGVHYYLGDNTGLVHTYVDSNNVVNGQTYYYAVVAYDHGDSLTSPPTETTKKITQDAVTLKYTFDSNTAKVIPGPRASGYVAPDASKFNLTHVNGTGNGTINLNILNDIAVPASGQYRLVFGDSLDGAAQKNYSVRKEAYITDAVQFYDTNYASLSCQNLDKASTFTVTDASGKTYVENVDYYVNYTAGKVRRADKSPIGSTDKYKVTYRYFPVYESTLLSNEDSNPLADGIKLQIVNHAKLEPDTVNSKWTGGKTNFKFTLKDPSFSGTRVRASSDFEVKFSANNIDSAKISKSGSFISIPVKYSVYDITGSVPLKVPTFLKEVVKDSAWEPGEEIVFFKPGSNATSKDTVTWGVLISLPDSAAGKPIYPTDGDVLVLRTNRPFTSSDVYTYTTQAGKVNNTLAKSKLDNIYVVPNPYVVYNDIEPTTQLPGATRGERRIYFENLPVQCKIRIFTLSGELIKTIDHEGTNTTGREFWNLLNNDGFCVAYGVYFAHIDAPGIGEKLVKFAIIK